MAEQSRGYGQPRPPKTCLDPGRTCVFGTIKYLGYTDEAAADICSRWIAQFPTGQPQELEPVFGKPFLDPIIGFSSGRFDLDADDGDDSK
ncbi:hypothetical protein TgHK011_002580 [Trichoderma gracile]|nr:hypothetical protein TgHK011_002580 [Trichoderma gracile]